MACTLIVLAAGLGWRFGGLKQFTPVGPHGESLAEYAVYDAIQAGVSRVVFVVQAEGEPLFRAQIAHRLERRLDVRCALQNSTGTESAGRAVPPREKPWGTGHAVLCGAEAAEGAMIVVNADDFYGRGGIHDLIRCLEPRDLPALRAAPQPAAVPCAMVAYPLEGTVPPVGAVSRAICKASPSGALLRIEEVPHIQREGARLVAIEPSGGRRVLSGSTPVSMNLWGFSPGIVPLLRARFDTFLSMHGPSPTMEFALPTAVGDLVDSGAVSVRVVPSREPWAGVTHRNDADQLAAFLRDMVQAGVYPSPLWS